MLKQVLSATFLFTALILISQPVCYGQHDPIEHTWYNGEKNAKVQIYKATDGNFYGKIIWMAEPNRDGKPKLDIHNSDPARRKDPLMGMIVLKQFRKKDNSHYEDGTIYDPKFGKTYSGKLEMHNGKLEVRGYLGISLLGRSATWTKAD